MSVSLLESPCQGYTTRIKSSNYASLTVAFQPGELHPI